MPEEAGATRHSGSLMGNFPFVAFQTLQAQNKRCVSERMADWFDLRANNPLMEVINAEHWGETATGMENLGEREGGCTAFPL